MHNTLNQLHARFVSKKIYTRTGIILISINPYTPLATYGQSAMHAYYNNRGSVEPHIYAVAEAAIQNYPINGDQTIVVSGESGSGKTYNCEHLLRYVIWRCNGNEELQNKLIASHYVLEYFGNAATQINHNSSRFGKYMRLKMKNDVVVGANIIEYLLEKSRVTHQARGCKNFHAFYLACARKGISFCNDYIDYEFSENDAEKVIEMEKRLRIFGFERIDELVETLVLILKIGSIKFCSESKGGIGSNTDTDENYTNELINTKKETLFFTSVVRDTNYNEVCSMLGVEEDDLEKLLVTDTLKIMKETVETNNRIEKAILIRDTLARTLYSQLFSALVLFLNKQLDSDGDCAISILDIYGFEVFEKNDFDQFCINWANERIQNEFIKRMFKDRQEFYKNEGIDFPEIEFPSNDSVLNLIERKYGLADLIDEECFSPCGSVESLLVKLKQNNYNDNCFIPTKNGSGIQIKHYAYPVEYCVRDFLVKNSECNLRFLNGISFDKIMSKLGLADIDDVNEEEVQIGSKLEDFVYCIEKLDDKYNDVLNSALATKKSVKSSDGNNYKKNTVIRQFRSSMNQLFSEINQTEIHYVRCIRPNRTNTPWDIDKECVEKQIKACGIVEIVTLSELTYPHIIPITKFRERYAGLDIQEEDGLKVGQHVVFIKHENLNTMEFRREEFCACKKKRVEDLISNWVALLRLKEGKNKDNEIIFEDVMSGNEKNINGTVKVDSDLSEKNINIINGTVKVDSDLPEKNINIIDGTVKVDSNLSENYANIINGTVKVDSDLSEKNINIINGTVKVDSDLSENYVNIINGTVKVDSDLPENYVNIIDGIGNECVETVNLSEEIKAKILSEEAKESKIESVLNLDQNKTLECSKADTMEEVNYLTEREALNLKKEKISEEVDLLTEKEMLNSEIDSDLNRVINEQKNKIKHLENELYQLRELASEMTIAANQNQTKTIEKNLKINLSSPHNIFECIVELFIVYSPPFTTRNVPRDEIVSMAHMVAKIIFELSTRAQCSRSAYLEMFIYEFNAKITQFESDVHKVAFFLGNLLELRSIFDDCPLIELDSLISTLFEHFCASINSSIAPLVPDAVVYHQEIEKLKIDDSFYRKLFYKPPTILKLINLIDYHCHLMVYFAFPDVFMRRTLESVLSFINTVCFNRILVEQNFLSFNRTAQINYNLNRLIKFCAEVGLAVENNLAEMYCVIKLVNCVGGASDFESVVCQCTYLSEAQVAALVDKIDGLRFNFAVPAVGDDAGLFLKEIRINAPVCDGRREVLFSMPRYIPAKYINSIFSVI